MVSARFTTRLLACACGLLLAIVDGCASGERDADVGSASRELSANNGTWLNGTWLNGTWLNGTWLNGTWLNGTWLNGTSLGGFSVSNVHLQGSQLVGTFFDRTIGGTDLTNAQLDGVDGDGKVVTLKITAAIAPPAGSDVWTYRIDYKDNGWNHLCGSDASGAAVAAIAVSGRWDDRQGVSGGGAKISDGNVVTFACRGKGAIAKCVDMGYRPWASTANGTSLDPHHQACVRMVRADVCGDGTSYTVDGTVINVYDAIGVQEPDTSRPWLMEAEWTPNGGRCVNPDGAQRLLSSGTRPSCLDSLLSATCGDPEDFESGTLTMTDIAAP